MLLESSAADGRAGRGVPAAGLANLRGERPVERRGDEASRLEHARERHAVLEARGVEQVDEVLGREIAGGAGCVRTAARAAGGAVEAADAGVQARDHVGERRAAR